MKACADMKACAYERLCGSVCTCSRAYISGVQYSLDPRSFLLQLCGLS